MKIARILMLLLMALPFCACEDDDPEYANLTEETKALRKKYNDQMVGDWTFEYASDRIKYYSQISLDKKGNYKETERVAYPQMDFTYGIPTTTWEVQSEISSTGKWYLEYDATNKRNIFNVSKDGMTIARFFYGIHDDQLFLSTAFITGQAAYERGKKQPSF